MKIPEIVIERTQKFDPITKDVYDTKYRVKYKTTRYFGLVETWKYITIRSSAGTSIYCTHDLNNAKKQAIAHYDRVRKKQGFEEVTTFPCKFEVTGINDIKVITTA